MAISRITSSARLQTTLRTRVEQILASQAHDAGDMQPPQAQEVVELLNPPDADADTDITECDEGFRHTDGN